MKVKNPLLHFAVCLLLLSTFASAANAQSAQAQKDNKPAYGKYGCTASHYSRGQIEYSPKGSFVIAANGTYVYYGFQQPSKGRFTVDKDGNLLFKGGYFDGGKAEKIDRPNKFFLTFPTIPDNRWTCSLVK